MKRKKLISTSLLFISLLLVGNSLAGCSDLLGRNTNNSTDSTGSDEDPTDTITPTDPTDSNDPTDEDPTDTITPTDQTDPSDPEPDPTTTTDPTDPELDPEPEPTTYKVTCASSSDYTVSGLDDSYEAGATVSFAVTMTSDTKELVSVAWNGNDITATDGTYSFTMPANDVTISITTTNKSYAVTYAVSDDYTISGLEDGYAYGDTVSFTVTPATGKNVTGVSISTQGEIKDLGDNKYSFIMPSEEVVISVTTENVYYTVSYDSRIDNYILRGIYPGYKYGETVSFTVTPVTGKKVTDVSIDTGETVRNHGNNEYSFTMPACNVAIIVTVENINYVVTYEQSSDYSISGLETGYKYGDTVSFTVTPATGKKLTDVSIDTGETVTNHDNNEYSFTMPASDVSISVTLENLSYAVTYDSSNDYSINIYSGTTYEYESTVSFTVTPATGKKVTEVTIDNGGTVTKGDNNEYSFTMPANDVVISVAVTNESYTVTYTSSNDYSISGIYNGTTYEYESNVSFTVAPSTGKKITNVSISAGTLESDGDNKYSFSMPASDVVISVITEDVIYNVTCDSSSDYEIIGLESTYTYGSTVSFIINPEDGKYINEVSISTGGTITELDNNEYSFSMPASDVIITIKSSSFSNEFMDTYGYANAYITYNTEDDRSLIVHLGSNISYYIDDSVTGDYYDAVVTAIEEANKLTSAITITTTDDPNSQWVIKVEEDTTSLAIGVNRLTMTNYGYPYSSGFYTVYVLNTASTIYLNSHHLDGKDKDYIADVAMHEIGHSFGLKDLGDDETKNISRMGSSSTYGYNEFDKLNIEWYYGS